MLNNAYRPLRLSLQCAVAVALAAPAVAQQIFSDGFESGDVGAWSAGFGVVVTCDEALDLADTNPVHGAQAMDICQQSVMGSAGLVSASYITVDGAQALSDVTNGLLGIGLLDDFGANVATRRGQRMLAISSGAARSNGDPGYQDPMGFSKGYLSSFPAGFPYEVASCSDLEQLQPHDSAAISLTLIPPVGATGFEVDFRFFTFDYSGYVCSTFMDQLVILVDPAPIGAFPGGNVAFDWNGRPVTVLGVQACAAGNHGGIAFTCPLGDGDLSGTGFDSNGATGWLTASAPVTPGVAFDLLIGVWDSGDSLSDSTVLVDAFRWTTD
jgi:hypothetical protein